MNTYIFQIGAIIDKIVGAARYAVICNNLSYVFAIIINLVYILVLIDIITVCIRSVSNGLRCQQMSILKTCAGRVVTMVLNCHYDE